MTKTVLTFDEALAALAGTSAPGPRLLRRLNNLGDEELAILKSAWPMLNPARRAYVVEKLTELAEDDVRLDFSTIFGITLGDEEARVRLASVEGLWEDETTQLIDPLAAMLRDDPSEVVRAVCAAKLGEYLLQGELDRISRYRRDQVYSALMGTILVSDPGSIVYQRALEGLAYVSNEQVEQLIREAYESDNLDLKVSAVLAMGRSSDHKYSDLVLEQLHSVQPAMRIEAARACGELEVTAAVPVLGMLIDDTETGLSFVVIAALGQIGGDEAKRLLEQAAKSDDEDIVSAAEEALDEYDLLHGDIKFNTSWIDEVRAGGHEHDTD
jgi:HEAT repeat protein